MSEPDYIVIRGSSETRVNGVWHNLTVLREQKVWPKGASVAFAPSGEFEVREDGAVAQVYRPRRVASDAA